MHSIIGLKARIIVSLGIILFPTAAFSRSPDLCANAKRYAPSKVIENDKGLTVAELLNIDASKVVAKPWVLRESKREALKNAKALLAFRPRLMSTQPLWAESVMLSTGSFLGSVPVEKGKILALEGTGTHGCVLDRAGQFWFVRMQAVDEARRGPQ